MDIKDESFIHFTNELRVSEILDSGKLKVNPPYEKFGIEGVLAISLTYGDFVPSVVTNHLKPRVSEYGPIVGIVFKTPIKPKYGHIEEVVWDQDVPLTNPRVVELNEGKLLVLRSPEKINEDDMVLYDDNEVNKIITHLKTMNKTASKRYQHIDFKPPESVAKAAERGLEYRKRSGGKGGLSTSQAKAGGIGSGVQRAVNLKNRDTMSPETVRRMKAFFDRHEKNKSIESGKKPWEDKGNVAWLCVTGDTEITLSDGTQKTIKEICENRLQVNVLSYNEKTKKIEPKKITNWFISDSDIKDFRILSRGKTHRQGINKRTLLKITDEHPIFEKEKWTPSSNAREFSVLDKKNLSEYARSALIGSLLGDGCITGGPYSFRYQESHGDSQYEYLIHKNKLFNTIGTTYSKRIATQGYGKGKSTHMIRSKSNLMLRVLRNIFYKKNKKIFPNYAKKYINDISLAFWFMDDGSLHYANTKNKEPFYRLHTEGFSKKDIDKIVDFFKKRYGYSCYANKRENCGGYIVIFNHLDSCDISKRISKHVVSKLRYKLINGFSYSFERPKVKENNEYTLSIDKIETNKKALNYYKAASALKPYRWSKKYNIEVEDNNNYFANGFLVHNCWGGDPGYSWAKKVVKQMEAADKRTKSANRVVLSFLKMAKDSQLEKGKKVEKEHEDAYEAIKKRIDTDMPVSKEKFYEMIAKAHLKEMPDYYTKLLEMEGDSHKKVAIDFSEINSLIQPGRSLTNRELARAIRLAISAEHDAVHLYELVADTTTNTFVRKIMQDVANEEKVHVGEFEKLLSVIDVADTEFVEEGKQEVEEMMVEEEEAPVLVQTPIHTALR